MSTVQSLYTSASYKFGQGPENIRFQDDFYSALNDAQNDFVTRRSWGFLRTSASLVSAIDVRAVALPSNFGMMFDIKGSVRITSPVANQNEEIEIITYEDWLTNDYEDGSETGTPSLGYILEDNLNLSPIPDVAYTFVIIYYKNPVSVENSSSTLTIPDIYGEVLQKMIYRRLQDAGYSSVQELQISDNDIQKLLGQYALRDIKKYGSLTFNLNNLDYEQRTI